MFAHRFFASRYFAPRYWPKVGGAGEPPVTAVARPHAAFRRRRRD